MQSSNHKALNTTTFSVPFPKPEPWETITMTDHSILAANTCQATCRQVSQYFWQVSAGLRLIVDTHRPTRRCTHRDPYMRAHTHTHAYMYKQTKSGPHSVESNCMVKYSPDQHRPCCSFTSYKHGQSDAPPPPPPPQRNTRDP